MSELQKIDTVVGDGKEAVKGNHVDVHYTGWLFDENDLLVLVMSRIY